jgi:hypothetical protein
MTIRMKNLERLTLAEMKEFVTTNCRVDWSAPEGAAVYGGWEVFGEERLQRWAEISASHISAPIGELSEDSGECTAHAGKDGRGTCGWTPFIKDSTMDSQVCITSSPQTR